MEIFRINLILFVVLGFFYKLKIVKHKTFCVLTGLQMFLLLVLRDVSYVGVDMGRYTEHYYNTAQMNFFDAFFYNGWSSSLYYLSNHIFASIGATFHQYVVVYSAFCISIWVFMIWKYSKDAFLSTLLFMGLGNYVFLFSGMRQSIAMSIGLLTIHWLFCKKNWKAFFSICIAVLFHTSAIILFPLLFVSQFRITKLRLILFGVVIGFTLLFRIQLAQLIVRYSVYSYYEGHYEIGGSISGVFLLLFCFCIWFILINWKDLRQQKSVILLSQWVFLLALGIQIFSSYAYAFTRLNLHYFQPIALIFPSSFDKVKLRDCFGNYYWMLSHVLYIAIVAGSIYLYLGQLKGAGVGMNNYRFFWEL